MALPAGTRIGSFEIVDALGSGGMGEVYRARDTTLNRDVALKILPDAVAADPDRLARLRREAQALAALNHPNIAHVYGLEDSGGRQALVMELVPGPTLAECIASGPLPPADALAIARQLADALESAHEAGIVHRDLKPANIKIKGSWGPTPTRLSDGHLARTRSVPGVAQGPTPTRLSDGHLARTRSVPGVAEGRISARLPDGHLAPASDLSDCVVKVLDFGLAKAMDAGPASAAGAPRSDAATITSPAPFDWRSGRPEHSRGAVTQMGMILGTAAYMAPEQAKGRAVDKRADIWAFGVVLCEMITGRRLFEAEDVSETLAAVLTRDVGEAALPADIPPRIRALIASCLVRDPRQRLRDIGDARIALDRLIAGAPEEAAAAAGVAAPPARSPGRLVWPAIAIVSLAAAAGLALTWRSDPAPAPAPVRFAVTPPDGVALEEATPRISPDGRKLAFVATHDSDSRIWVHDFETAVAAPLESTRDLRPGAWGWSPDSRSIMFSTSDTIRRADIAGGPSRAIATAMSSAGDWSLRGVILFAAGRDGGPIQQVSENGGEPAPVTALDATMQEFAHRAPHLLPGGRHFTFLAVDPLTRTRAAYVGTLGSAERRPLPGITSEAKYSPTGHLLFLREGALMAQPFDLERLELGGTPVVVLEDAAPPAALGAPFSVSSTGTFVHRAGSSRVSQLTWFDRSGARLGTVGPPGAYADIEISRDERYVVYEAGPPPGDIWVLDTKTGIAERATSGPSREADPVWSPDGRRIAFRSDGAGGRLHVQTFGGVAGDTLLHESEERESPGSWSADGKFLAYHSRAGIFALPLSGDPTPIRVTDAAVNAEEPQISPDGRWIAYESRELGQLDVFVQSFPVPTVKRRVSIAGGRNPRWRHDSRELYYLAFDLTMMGVTIDDAGGTLSTGAPVALFEVPIALPREGEYTVSASGRFLINVPSGDPRDRPIWVDLHWRPPGR